MASFVVRVLLGFVMAISTPIWSLPIGFGVNQSERTYAEQHARSTMVYFDARAPHEAKMVAESIEAARPVLERWLDIAQGDARLPVVMSAVSSGASFANFVTDAIELQTLGRGHRDLFWHEYTHMMMYRHFHNFLGPAGAIFQLPWIPAWFIEGLAESLAMSDGSDWMAAVERYQAFTGDWPTYDRLHPILIGSSFAVRGYATAGGFVRWLLQRAPAAPGHFGDFLRQLDRYTWPQYYLWSFNPFSRFMPMDETLRAYYGQSGEELYALYQRESEAFWKKHSPQPLFLDPGSGSRFSAPVWLHLDNGKAAVAQRHKDGIVRQTELSVDSSSSWARADGASASYRHQKVASFVSLNGRDGRVEVRGDVDLKDGRILSAITVQARGSGSWQDLTTGMEGHVGWVGEDQDRWFWHEEGIDRSQLCHTDKASIGERHCPISMTLPKSTKVLGVEKDANGWAQVVWLGLSEQTLQGDRHQVLRYVVATGSLQQLAVFDPRMEPVRMVSRGDQYLVLVREHGYRAIWQIGRSGACIRRIPLADMATDMLVDGDGQLWLKLWTARGYRIRVLSDARLSSQSVGCRTARGMTSPLIYAMSRHQTPDLAQAIAATTYQAAPHVHHDPGDDRLLAKPLGSQLSAPAGDAGPLKTAAWRSRHILTMPWLGADDALGPQLGLVSVPVMDHLQNETVRLTFLYGVASRFPNTQLSLLSTRYWPDLEMTLFRHQLYNGVGRDAADAPLSVSYLDERGAKFSGRWRLFFTSASLTFELGLKSSIRDRYLGPSRVVEGELHQPFVAVGWHQSWRRFSYRLGLNGAVAPAAINPVFDFFRLGINGTISYKADLLRSKWSLTTAASRTDGKAGKVPDLKEYYTPQRTFLAGSGGGYNQNSFGLFGDGSLFVPRFGDRKAMAELKWKFPLWRKIQKNVWLFYFEKLMFTAFANRGGAWFQGQSPHARWVSAHGYAVDLLFQNKGVRFNAGLGYGQVIDEPFQLYATAGFDALF